MHPSKKKPVLEIYFVLCLAHLGLSLSIDAALRACGVSEMKIFLCQSGIDWSIFVSTQLDEVDLIKFGVDGVSD